ncbi:Growth-regulating factor 5, partial [Ananas comosus]
MESNTAEVGEKRDRSHDQEDLGHSFGFKCNSFHTLVRSPEARTSGGGGGGGVGGVTMATTSAFPFTAVQWAELQRQALIYKHIIASVPVPYCLLIPFVNMYFIHAVYNLKHLNTMELEARRCHRTDGKKWRCSREAAPDRKYCDHHMRRTRPRSRKHAIETRKTTTAPPNLNFLSKSTDPKTKPTSNFREEITFNTIHQQQYKNKLMLNHTDLNRFCFPFPDESSICSRKENVDVFKTDGNVISSLSISTLLRLSVSCNTMEGSRSSIGGPLGEVLVSLSESSSSDSPSFAQSENVR